MEMGEHCTSRGEPADPPIARCERRFHTSFVWWTIRCECAGTEWLLLRGLHMLHHWTNLLVTPLTHSPDLATGANPPTVSPCDLPFTYGHKFYGRLWV